MRHLRAMAAALACVTTALGAHSAAGGQTGLGTVVVAFVLSGAVAWGLAGARLTRAQFMGLLVLCQVGVHLASMASSQMPHSMGPSMWLAHGAATAVSLALLARGESFVWAVAQHLALKPLTILRTVHVPAMRRLLVSTAAPTSGPRVEARLTPVRGPPAKPAFAASFL